MLSISSYILLMHLALNLAPPYLIQIESDKRKRIYALLNRELSKEIYKEEFNSLPIN